MSYSREPLSGSTNGRGIKVAATSTPGTTIHTAQSGASLVDVVTLYAVNSDTVGRTVTLEWGGTTSPDDTIAVDLPPAGGGPIPLAVDLVLQNSLVIKAFCPTANVVMVHGYVNREA